VLLAPERAVALDDIATAIVTALDGTRTIGDVADMLSQRYEAPPEQVLQDVLGFVRQFVDRGLLEVVGRQG
jgi:pyrroloquinoline quinone biosynthesis protein D